MSRLAAIPLIACSLAAGFVVAPAVRADEPGDPFYVPGEPVHDDEIFAFFLGDRIEYQSREGSPVVVWDMDAWIGQDMNKFWLKSEGDYDIDSDQFGTVSIEPLYSRPVSAYWDVQLGLRHDFIDRKDDRTFLSVGVQGLAPGFFEVDPTLFLSTEADLSIEAEVEYDQLLTQRLIFQPRMELELQAQDVPELGIGAGFSSIEAGARLRYGISRQFAPYLGISWERSLGETADIAREAGSDPGVLSVVAGVRLWF